MSATEEQRDKIRKMAETVEKLPGMAIQADAAALRAVLADSEELERLRVRVEELLRERDRLHMSLHDLEHDTSLFIGLDGALGQFARTIHSGIRAAGAPIETADKEGEC